MAEAIFEDKVRAAKSYRRFLDALGGGDPKPSPPSGVKVAPKKKERQVFRRDPVTGKVRVEYVEE
jgi:hypothetical protein